MESVAINNKNLIIIINNKSLFYMSSSLFRIRKDAVKFSVNTENLTAGQIPIYFFIYKNKMNLV